MDIINGLEGLGTKKKCAVTIGTFDGVHPGHLRIIDRLKGVAEQRKLCTTLITFYPHPKMVLHKAPGQVRLLTTIDEKIEFLKKTGLSRLVVIPFDKHFSQITYEKFVKNVILDQLGAEAVVVGYDHAFGKNREGNFDRLKIMADQNRFYVEKVEPYRINNVTISSTLLREALLSGNVSQAAEWLGRLYSLKGKVVRGASRGKDLGFPTANIMVDNKEKLIPKNGVYGVDVVHATTTYKGMMNIGIKPTFSDNLERGLEVHILNFDGQIYNQEIEVRFKKRLRNEIKFESIEKLKAQLKLDKIESLKI